MNIIHNVENNVPDIIINLFKADELHTSSKKQDIYIATKPFDSKFKSTRLYKIYQYLSF